MKFIMNFGFNLVAILFMLSVIGVFLFVVPVFLVNGAYEVFGYEGWVPAVTIIAYMAVLAAAAFASVQE